MFVEHRSTDFGMERRQDPGRRRGDGLGHGQRAHGLRVRQGLHGVRRLALGGACPEDHQDPGHGPEGPRADRRACSMPGGRASRRGWRRSGATARFQAQRDRLGGHPADLGDHGAVRGRGRLLAGDDRLHLHGARPLLHVRDRARRWCRTVTNESRERRGARRGRVHTTKSSIADGAYDNDVEALLQMRRLIDFLPANNLDGGAGDPELRRSGPDRRRASTPWFRTTPTSPTT